MFARKLVSEGLIGVNWVCRLVGISKDTYYHSQDPKSTLTTKYQKLKPKVIEIIEANPAYGYPRIKKALEERFGEVVNHKLLLKLLKLWGLTLKRKVRTKKKGWLQRVLDFLGFRANLLFSLVVNGVFQVIVSDITEIIYDHGGRKAYLGVHLDYFGKMILGWSISAHPDTALVLTSFKMATTKLKRLKQSLTGIVFHQDQGSVYTSADYTTAVLGEGAYLSFSRKGEPGDNAVNEAFFSRLKDEQKDTFYEIEDSWELETAMRKAIDYYNYKRYHTSIGTVTPWNFTQKMIVSFSR